MASISLDILFWVPTYLCICIYICSECWLSLRLFILPSFIKLETLIEIWSHSVPIDSKIVRRQSKNWNQIPQKPNLNSGKNYDDHSNNELCMTVQIFHWYCSQWENGRMLWSFSFPTKALNMPNKNNPL